jgi:hypothetical protein
MCLEEEESVRGHPYASAWSSYPPPTRQPQKSLPPPLMHCKYLEVSSDDHNFLSVLSPYTRLDVMGIPRNRALTAALIAFSWDGKAFRCTGSEENTHGSDARVQPAIGRSERSTLFRKN